MQGIVRKGKHAGEVVTIIDWDGYWFSVAEIEKSLKPNNLLFSLDTIDKIIHDPRSRQLNINYKSKIDYAQRLSSNCYMRFAERPEQYEAPSLPS